MVEVIPFEDINAAEIVKRMKSGEIIIYPTDTIYSIGCNASKPGSISVIREMSKRESEEALSVIAPSKKWIYDHFEIKKKSYIQTLPGPFTFVLNMNRRGVARNVNPGSETLGVRIPYHAFSRLVQRASIPFITKNLYLSGQKPVREINDIPRSILRKVDLVIDGGFLPHHPSTVIDLTGDMARILKR